MRQLLFSFAQRILYIICNLAWDHCNDHLSDFAGFKSKYTGVYIDDAKKEIDNAKKLSTTRQRTANRKQARIKLIAAKEPFLILYGKLKEYIKDAFPATEVEVNYQKAGSAYYEQAAASNWQAFLNLIDASRDYIEENKTALYASNNMPPAFAAGFNTTTNDCINLVSQFFQADIVKKNGTAAKRNANNAIYKALLAMLADAQSIYKGSSEAGEILRHEFTITYFEAIAKGVGTAGYKGYVFTSNGLPVAGATVTSENGKYSGITNARGFFHIRQMQGDATYSFNIVKPGFVTAQASATLKPGVTPSKVRITLSATTQSKAA